MQQWISGYGQHGSEDDHMSCFCVSHLLIELREGGSPIGYPKLMVEDRLWSTTKQLLEQADTKTFVNAPILLKSSYVVIPWPQRQVQTPHPSIYHHPHHHKQVETKSEERVVNGGGTRYPDQEENKGSRYCRRYYDLWDFLHRSDCSVLPYRFPQRVSV